MLAGHFELAALLLELPEEAHILDSDDGLGREPLEQRDLLFGEQADHRPRDRNRPDGRTVLQHGH